jgi:hypothetical protein
LPAQSKNRGLDESASKDNQSKRIAFLQAATDQERAWRAQMLVKFREERAPADFIYAFEKTGNFVTRENRDEWSAQDLKEWDGLLQAYRRRVAMEGRIIDLCFRLRPESARSEISRHTRFAAAEFWGCCSFRSRTGDQLVCSGTDLSGSLAGFST